MLFLPCLECQRVLLGSFNNYLGLIPTTQHSNHSGVCTFHWNAENLQFGNNQKGNSIGAAATWVSHMKTANFPISNPIPSPPPHCNGGLAAASRWALNVLCVAAREAHRMGGQEEGKTSGQILTHHLHVCPSPHPQG